jgi:pyruvate,water dikinase
LKKLPPALKGLVFKMIRQNLGLIRGVLQALRNPTEFKCRYFEEEERLRKALKAIEAEKEPFLAEFATRTMRRMVAYATVFGAGMAAAELARSRIKGLFKDEKPEIRDQVVYLGRALPNNVTIEMGLAMYRLARFEEISECASGEIFASRLAERAFSPEFLEAWDVFMEEYGFRGPVEMDVAAPRFYEQPALFFEQLRTMAESTDATNDPQAIPSTLRQGSGQALLRTSFDKAGAQREKAYEGLLQIAQKKGKHKGKQFEKQYNILVELGGLRERPKYFVSLLTDMFRRRVLAAAQPLLDAGRLDSPEQVFDLHMDDFERGLADPSLDRASSFDSPSTLRRGLS